MTPRLIGCACGCGGTFAFKAGQGNVTRRFINGHNANVGDGTDTRWKPTTFGPGTVAAMKAGRMILVDAVELGKFRARLGIAEDRDGKVGTGESPEQAMLRLEASIGAEEQE